MTKEPAHTPRWLWSANDKARSSNRYIVRLFHFELRAGVGSSGIGPVQSDMKTGDLAGPDRCLGTNPRTRPNPRRISDLPIEFRSSGRGFTQDLRAKNQCTAGGHQRVFIEIGHFEARLGPTAPVGGCATRFRAAFDRTARV